MYRSLDVYQRAKRIGMKIHQKTKEFPIEERYEIASQIRRAVVSIAVNIAEGYSRKVTVKEYRYFLRISTGSTSEVRVLLEYCKEFGYITESEYGEYEIELEIISKQLYRLSETLKPVS